VLVLQIQCRTNTYSQSFFSSAVYLSNALPVDVCQLLPGSFKAQLYVLHHTDVDACRPCFYLLHRTVFIHFVSLFVITASASCTWTGPIHHRGAILLDLRVGTFMEEEEEEAVQLHSAGED